MVDAALVCRRDLAEPRAVRSDGPDLEALVRVPERDLRLSRGGEIGKFAPVRHVRAPRALEHRARVEDVREMEDNHSLRRRKRRSVHRRGRNRAERRDAGNGERTCG